MPNVVLASGRITHTDQLSVELVQAIEIPPAILMRWPAAATVTDPRRFPAAALAVIARTPPGTLGRARNPSGPPR